MVQHLRLSRRNRPVFFFCFFFFLFFFFSFLLFFFFSFLFPVTLQNLSYKQVYSAHTMRVQAQGEQLHQAHLVIPCTVIYPHMCFGQHFVTVPSDYDHVLCASVQTLRCVPLCTPQNRRFAGFNEWLMNADAEAE